MAGLINLSAYSDAHFFPLSLVIWDLQLMEFYHVARKPGMTGWKVFGGVLGEGKVSILSLSTLE